MNNFFFLVRVLSEPRKQEASIETLVQVIYSSKRLKTKEMKARIFNKIVKMQFLKSTKIGACFFIWGHLIQKTNVEKKDFEFIVTELLKLEKI